MSNSKLLNIVTILTKKEVTQIRKMLKSPFFTNRKDLGNLFEILMGFAEKSKPFPSRSVIFKKLWPNKKIHDLKLRAVMSDLLQIIEECWLINSRRANQLESQLTLADIYRQRKQDKSYKSTLKKTEILLNNFPYRNADFFKYQLNFQTEQMDFHSQSKRTDHLFLQEISDSIDELFLIQKLRHTCAQLSHALVIQTNYNYGLLNDLIQSIESKNYIQNPAIAIYYYCFRFLTDPNQIEYFQKFKTQLENTAHLFTQEDLEAPYRLALNFCIRKINQGVSSFIQDSWDLYKTGIENGVLLENNQLSRFTFNNTIAAALKLKKFDWITNFIQTNKNKLTPDFRDQTISFNLARLAFEQQQYGDALLHLQNAEYKDLVNSLIAKMLLVKIYVELEEYESLDSHLDSFQQYIRRREVSDYHRTNFLNIIRLTKKVITLPIYGKKEREKLRKEIEGTEVLSERKWLLEKVS